MNVVEAVVQGLLLGGQYALFAAGLSLMFGVMRLVNLAHGDVAVLAAYGAVLVVNVFVVSPLVALAVVVPLTAVLGYVTQRFLLQHTLGPPLPSLLVTFGLSIIIQNALLLGWSADQQRLSLGRWNTASFSIGELSLGVLPVAVFVLAVVLLLALGRVITHTQYGRLVRAVSDDPETVQLSGVDPRKIYAIAAAIAFGLVAVAGIATGIRTSFSPTAGSLLLIFAFEAVIIGGLGSLRGTLVGALVLGVSQTVGGIFFPAQQVLIGHLVFLLVLVVRPQGIVRQGAFA